MLATKKRGIPVRFFLAGSLAMLLSSCTPPGPRALLRGEKLIQERDYAAAIEYLDEAVRLLPGNAQAWNHLGLAYQYSGQSGKALEAYQHALVLDRNLSPSCFNAGCLNLETGNYSLAVDYLTTFTSLQPRSTEGWLRLASAQTHWAAQQTGAERLRLLDTARRSYDFVNHQHPSAEALNGLGMVSLYRGRQRDALSYFDAALQAQPNYAPALLNLAVIYHNHLGDHRLALAKYHQYLSLTPRPANYAAVESVARQLQEELNPPPPKPSPPPAPAPAPPPAATNSIIPAQPLPVTNHPAPVKNPVPSTPAQPVARPEPRSSAPPISREQPTREPASHDTAAAPPRANKPPEPAPAPSPVQTPPARLAVANTAIAQTPPPSSPATQISTAPPPATGPAPTNLSKETSPAPNTNPVAAIPPNQPPPPPAKHGFFSHLNPATWFPKKSDHPPEVKVAAGPKTTKIDAAPAPTETAPAEPPPIPRYHYLSPAKGATGDHQEASKYFGDGVLEHKNRHYPEAIRLYEKATNLDPAYFEAYYNLGLAAHEQGEMAASLTSYEHALALNPDYKDLRYNFGLALLKGGYVLDAANEFQQLLDTAPDDARLHLALANIHAQKLGNDNEARKHYQKVLEEDPANPQAAAIRTWLATHP